jgi:hypothetical protein
MAQRILTPVEKPIDRVAHGDQPALIRVGECDPRTFGVADVEGLATLFRRCFQNDQERTIRPQKYFCPAGATHPVARQQCVLSTVGLH